MFCIAVRRKPGKQANPGQNLVAALAIPLRKELYKTIKVVMRRKSGQCVVVEPGPTKHGVFQGKRRLTHYVKPGAAAHRQSDDVAGIGRNFGFK